MIQNGGNGGEEHSKGNSMTGGSAGEKGPSQQDLGERGDDNNQRLKNPVFVLGNTILADY